MKSVTFLGVLLVSCTVLAGCARTKVTISQYAEPKVKACAIQVFSTEEEVTKPFKVLCTIDSKTGTNAFSKKTVQQAVELAKPKACQCGADAIIVTSAEKEGVSFSNYGYGQATIKAIKFD